VILMVVPQTYGGFLNFYSNLHTLVSAGGLDESRIRWIGSLDSGKEQPKHEVMLAWRFALLAYLDAAIKANVLRSDLSVDELTQILHAEEKRN
jgi:hypothetical protein